MSRILSFFVICTAILAISSAEADYVWQDSEGKHLELLYKNKPLARYVYEAIDESSAERREETFKPFCHLYSYRWKHYGKLLTKGAGGQFTHHRGVFYGFNRISYSDVEGVKHQSVDTWHCRKAYQIHRRFTAQTADKNAASFTAEIDWVGNDGKVFATEARTMRFSVVETDTLVDFESVLTPIVPELHLDGDPQHAGFHFRAHNDVFEKTEKATYYIRPGSGIGLPGQTINWSAKADNEKTRDLPWKAMCITLNDAQTTIVYLDRPENPKPARASERSYGRFGTYFATTVTPDKPLTVRYRLLVHPGEYENAAEIEALSKSYLALP